MFCHCRKPTRGIQYLVHERLVQDEPMEVAKFICGNGLFSKEKIGEFVGEIRQDFNVAVLEWVWIFPCNQVFFCALLLCTACQKPSLVYCRCMVELIDLSGKTIDGALRKFQELFRMPVSLAQTLFWSVLWYSNHLWSFLSSRIRREKLKKLIR